VLVGRGGERGSELGRVGCRKEGELALASGLAGQRHFWCVRACRIWAVDTVAASTHAFCGRYRVRYCDLKEALTSLIASDDLNSTKH